MRVVCTARVCRSPLGGPLARLPCHTPLGRPVLLRANRAASLLVLLPLTGHSRCRCRTPAAITPTAESSRLFLVAEEPAKWVAALCPLPAAAALRSTKAV